MTEYSVSQCKAMISLAIATTIKHQIIMPTRCLSSPDIVDAAADVPVAIELVGGTWETGTGVEALVVPENPHLVTNDSRFEASALSKGCMHVAHESRAFAPPG